MTVLLRFTCTLLCSRFEDSIKDNKIFFREHNYPVGRYVPTFQFSGNGVIIAIDNINVFSCHGEYSCIVNFGRPHCATNSY
jgi:hypothetical protein